MSYDTRQVSDAAIEVGAKELAASRLLDDPSHQRAAAKRIYLAMKAADQPTDEIASLKAKLEEAERERDELRAERDARQLQAEATCRYYQETNCACTAAERYVPDCPKHGFKGDRG